MSKNTPPSPPERKPRRIPERIKLSGASCKPGLALMERIAHSRKPYAEDVAVLNAWAFRFPVKIVKRLPEFP